MNFHEKKVWISKEKKSDKYHFEEHSVEISDFTTTQIFRETILAYFRRSKIAIWRDLEAVFWILGHIWKWKNS